MTAIKAEPSREAIARAICCPEGCQFEETCYCDASDFNGSGIERRTHAVIAALRTPAGDAGMREAPNVNSILWVCEELAYWIDSAENSMHSDDDDRARVTEGRAAIAAALAPREAEPVELRSSPGSADITMQDVRLVCGEGKLENRHVLNAVNIIIKRRAEMADAISNAAPADRSTAKATANVGDDGERMGSEPAMGIVTGGSDPTLSCDSAQCSKDPDGYNGCYRQAIAALNYLASNTRPVGGQDHFNAEHLLQIADEMKRSRPVSSTHQSAPHPKAPHNSGERLPSSDAASGGADTAVVRFQQRIVDMIANGSMGFHLTVGGGWHELPIEDRCKYILRMWDAKGAPLDFKDSRSMTSQERA